MNTPNYIYEKELCLPEIPIKNKLSNNVEFTKLNNIKKNLCEGFDVVSQSDYLTYPNYSSANTYSSAKKYPRINFVCPLAPNKIKIPRLDLSHSSPSENVLDNVRTRLFFENDNVQDILDTQVTQYTSGVMNKLTKTPKTPKTPIKRSRYNMDSIVDDLINVKRHLVF